MVAIILRHSAKGSEWKDHKYVKKVDGKYFYPDSYEGGRHVGTEKSKEVFAKGRKFAAGSRFSKDESSSNQKKSESTSSAQGNKKESDKKYIPKAAVDPNDRKAVYKRMNESLGKTGKANIRPGKGSKKNAESKDSEENQALGEQYAEKLEDAKITLEELKDIYSSSDKDEKVQIKKQIASAQADLKRIQSQIKMKTKNNKELRKIINELMSN